MSTPLFLIFLSFSAMAMAATQGSHEANGVHPEPNNLQSRQSFDELTAAGAAAFDPTIAAASVDPAAATLGAGWSGIGSLYSGPLGYGVFRRTSAGLTLSYLGLGEEAALLATGDEDDDELAASSLNPLYGGLGGLFGNQRGTGFPWTFPSATGSINNNFGFGAGFYRPYQLVAQYTGTLGFRGGYYRSQRGLIVPLRSPGVPYLGYLRNLRHLRRPNTLLG